MPRISVAFLTIAALCGLSGMVWGAYMGVSGDHTMMPAHAHLNLLGWASLAIMGLFYALPAAPRGRLAWTNFWLSSLGAILMAPMLAFLLGGHERQMGPWMTIPEALVFLGLVCFLIDVLLSGRRTAV